MTFPVQKNLFTPDLPCQEKPISPVHSPSFPVEFQGPFSPLPRLSPVQEVFCSFAPGQKTFVNYGRPDDGSGQSGQRRGSAEGAALPCLFSNNSIQHHASDQIGAADKQKLEAVRALAGLLSPYYQKAAHTLFSNVERLINMCGLDNIGFLTLTFVDNVEDAKEALRRFNSFNTNYLKPSFDFGHYICVKERQKRGSWHYHLLIDCKRDIRNGLDFDSIESGNYSSANHHLRYLWSRLREELPKYGFGRSELLPIKSNGEAMARYVGKYISKHIGKRDLKDKGVRLVSYTRGWCRNSLNFQWQSEGSAEWRRKLYLFALMNGCFSLGQLTDKLGSDWAFKYGGFIIDFPYNDDSKVEEYKRCIKPFESSTLGVLRDKYEKRALNYLRWQLATGRIENVEPPF